MPIINPTLCYSGWRGVWCKFLKFVSKKFTLKQSCVAERGGQKGRENCVLKGVSENVGCLTFSILYIMKK